MLISTFLFFKLSTTINVIMERRKELGILKREYGAGVGWPLILSHMAWIYVYVCGERHSIVNILDDDSDYTMEMTR